MPGCCFIATSSFWHCFASNFSALFLPVNVFCRDLFVAGNQRSREMLIALFDAAKVHLLAPLANGNGLIFNENGTFFLLLKRPTKVSTLSPVYLTRK